MSKIKKYIIMGVIGYLVFAGIIISLFYLIQNNPIDAAIPYIRENSGILEREYGEIITIGRHLSKRKEETKNTADCYYGVETSKGQIIVKVKLNKENSEWIPQSLSVEEFQEKVNK